MRNKNEIKLDQIKKADPFHAPEGYFNELPAEIEARISKEAHGLRGKSLSLYETLGYAAAAAVAVVLTFTQIQSPEKASSQQLLSKIPDEELISYLEFEGIADADLVDVQGSWQVEDESQIPEMLPEIDDETLNYLYQEYGISIKDTL